MSKPFAQSRFLRQVILFLSPFLFVLCMFEILFWQAGETWPVTRVIEYQREHLDALFLRGKFDQQICRYKYLGLREAKPRILALGSSRVMKFRTEMFGEGSGSFYNGTGLIDQIEDLDDFLELFRNNLPKVIILGIDPWILNEQRHSTRRLATSLEPDAALDWKGHLAILRHLRGRDLGRLWTAAIRRPPERIGAAATMNNEGYRWDGSFATHLSIDGTNWAFRDRESPPVPERIRKAKQRFEATPHASQVYLARLARDLRLLKNSGVTVIGFLPPFSSEANRLLSTLPDQEQFWSEYKAASKELFQNLSMPFFDATDLSTLGLDDRYMFDGMHAEETFHLHLLRRLLKDPAVQAALPNTSARVEAALSDPATNFYYPRFSK